MKKTFSALLVLLVVIAACEKKYEDGPYLSLRSKEKRLIGDWKVTRIEGEKAKMRDTVAYSLTFSEDKNFELRTDYTKMKDLVQQGVWEFSEDERGVWVNNITMIGVDTSQPYSVSYLAYRDSGLYSAANVYFKIIELRAEKIKLDAEKGFNLELERY